MGWGTYRHRPLTGWGLGATRRWRRGRAIAIENGVSVLEPMRDQAIVEGVVAIPTARAADVLQRAYLKSTSKSVAFQRGVRARCSLVQAASPEGPWTEISSSVVTTFDTDLGLPTAYQLSVSPDDYRSFSYISLSTTVWQPTEKWEEPGFEVVHELWCNPYVFSRQNANDDLVQTDRHHYKHDLTNRRKPGWQGG